MTKKKEVFSFKNLNKKEYKLYFGIPKFSYKRNGKKVTIEVCGICDSDDHKIPKIIISKGLGPKVELGTIVEEIFHAFFFDKKEKEARPFARTLAKFLYKQGWRKTKT